MEFKFTDDEWREYQSIPDQGYSHREFLEGLVNRRFAALTSSTSHSHDWSLSEDGTTYECWCGKERPTATEPGCICQGRGYIVEVNTGTHPCKCALPSNPRPERACTADMRSAYKERAMSRRVSAARSVLGKRAEEAAEPSEDEREWRDVSPVTQHPENGWRPSQMMRLLDTINAVYDAHDFDSGDIPSAEELGDAIIAALAAPISRDAELIAEAKEFCSTFASAEYVDDLIRRLVAELEGGEK